MRIDILSLFPEMFYGVFRISILKKAEEKKLVSYDIANFRDFSDDKHKTVDDYPYGGGPGMVLKPQPIFDAVDYIRKLMQNTTRELSFFVLKEKLYSTKSNGIITRRSFNIHMWTL